MAVIAYLRVSSSKQDVNSQRLAVLDFAHREGIIIDEFIQVEISTRKSAQKKELDGILSRLQAGDRLLVSELSRIGRTIANIIMTLDTLIKQGIHFTAIRENICITGTQDMQSKMLVTMFGLLAELERDLISQRTKEGLKNARAKGKTIGRPKGSQGKSKLDGREREIAGYLDKGVTRANIARILGVSRPTLNNFILSRKLVAGTLLKQR